MMSLLFIYQPAAAAWAGEYGRKYIHAYPQYCIICILVYLGVGGKQDREIPVHLAVLLL